MVISYQGRIRVIATFAIVALALSLIGPVAVRGSSHREAPLISTDPQADNTDLYAFVSPDNPDTVTIIGSFYPFQEPSGGPNFFSFGDDVHYVFHIDNDGDAEADISYVFEFDTQVRNNNTFLYNTGEISSLNDEDWNVRQTYKVLRIEDGNTSTIATDLATPPVNIGPKSTPNYSALSNSAVHTINGDTKVFAGQTDDPFFVDLGAVFDLLTIRKLPGNDGGGVDGLKGYNVMSIALQIPKEDLTSDGEVPEAAESENAVIGVWSTTTRKKTRVLNTNGDAPDTSGDYVQVSRLGAPLVNEVVIPLEDKDVWNASVPSNDTQFANYVTDPEVGVLLNALYGIRVPPQGPFGTDDARDDLVAIFLTGIPGLNQPTNVTPSEQMRLNMAIEPSSSPNPLGVVGGDNAGYPNGRRLADDVTDISLKAVAGAAYPLFHEEFEPDPLAAQLGDGVDRNDVGFRSFFPYLALPHQGFDSRPHASTSASLDQREAAVKAREDAVAQREASVGTGNDNMSGDSVFRDINSFENPGAINFLYDLGVVDGYSDGTFRPFDPINRAEFVKIIVESQYDDDDIYGTGCFPDVRTSQWFEVYVCTAKRLGLVNGYNDDTFRPSAYITSEEAYKVVTEMYFPDAVGIRTNPWYRQYLEAASSNGYLISSTRVGARLNRGQMALILALAMGYEG